MHVDLIPSLPCRFRWNALGSHYPEPAEETVGDINRDGVVDILDLTIVGARFGQRGQNSADLNGDGLVDIVDLVLVASEFGGDAAAPSLYPQALELLTAADLRQWLNQAQQLALTDSAHLNGIAVLEQLHAALIPQETVLLPNYPNPFNPETWIPYRLAEDASVALTIYDQSGQIVRTLDVGHQAAASYETRSKAIYWDGRNEIGEQVGSGVYFYHLSAGDYSATRKMLILK
ncbi:T9SS type A sorting domain-containing protein [Candidatus Poribacteria bacterium]|nr:T9SS type A sorting domain-containing protein [Candidatus Poribacteria bacterium]